MKSKKDLEWEEKTKEDIVGLEIRRLIYYGGMANELLHNTYYEKVKERINKDRWYNDNKRDGYFDSVDFEDICHNVLEKTVIKLQKELQEESLRGLITLKTKTEIANLQKIFAVSKKYLPPGSEKKSGATRWANINDPKNKSIKSYVENLSELSSRPDRILAAKQINKKIRLILTLEEHILLNLKFLLTMTLDEIVAITTIPRATVAYRITQAIAKLAIAQSEGRI